MSVNKVILLGNLGRDPEMRVTSSQVPVCTLNIATNERRKDASGNWSDHTEWHSVVVFGKTAENCAQYLKKGRQVFVEGRIQTRKWQDKEGKDRYTTEVIANSVQFIGGGAGAGRGGDYQAPAMQVSSPDEVAAGKGFVSSLPSADALAGGGAGSAEQVPFDDDDIPF